MRMQALKGFKPDHLDPANKSVVNPGHEFETTDARAKDYEVRGLAIPIGEISQQPKPAAEPTPNKAADAGPLREAGGRAGAERPSFSSRAARAQEMPRSTKPGAKRGR